MMSDTIQCRCSLEPIKNMDAKVFAKNISESIGHTAMYGGKNSITKSWSSSPRISQKYYDVALKKVVEIDKNRKEEDEKMGLQIKKTDVMDIDEFRETEKAYDKVELIIDMEKFEKYEREYGERPFVKNITDDVTISNKVIEFFPKALKVYSDGYEVAYSIPYEYIAEVKCIYYLTTE